MFLIIAGFECRCGGLYCSLHRYSDMHECSFDYRELGAQEIRRNNPVVVGEKIQKIWEDCAAGLFLTPLHLLVMALKQTESASGSEPVLLFWFEPIARMTLEHWNTHTRTRILSTHEHSKNVHTHTHIYTYIQTRNKIHTHGINRINTKQTLTVNLSITAKMKRPEDDRGFPPCSLLFTSQQWMNTRYISK